FIRRCIGWNCAACWRRNGEFRRTTGGPNTTGLRRRAATTWWTRRRGGRGWRRRSHASWSRRRGAPGNAEEEVRASLGWTSRRLIPLFRGRLEYCLVAGADRVPAAAVGERPGSGDAVSPGHARAARARGRRIGGGRPMRRPPPVRQRRFGDGKLPRTLDVRLAGDLVAGSTLRRAATAAQSGVYGGGRGHVGARHRRHHCHLQHAGY